MSERSVATRRWSAAPERLGRASTGRVGDSAGAVGSRTVALVVVLLLAATGAAALQPEATDSDATTRLVVHVHTMKHQAAIEGMALVLPLLSPLGTIEVSPGGNTLVVRDTPATLSRIAPVLESFDHSAREVEVVVTLVRARVVDRVSGAPEPPPSEVPAPLLARLRAHLPYGDYELVAERSIRGWEGEEMSFDLGDGFRIRFRLGTVIQGQRVRLHGFEVVQLAGRPGGVRPKADDESLLRSNLNLWLDRTMVLAMTAGSSSPRALMVVLRCRAPASAVAEVR